LIRRFSVNTDPRQIVCDLIATHGAALCGDISRCEGFLRDYCPHDRGKVNVLVSALKERVVADLLSRSASVPIELLLGRLAKRLEDHCLIREDMAQWAVETWALALEKSGQPRVTKDEDEAVKGYRKAADQGDAEAQNNLGVCYATGQGVAKDAAEAVKWYRKAADQGLAAAQYNLGVCYENGQGVPKDESEAVKWYRMASDQGNNFTACALKKSRGIFGSLSSWFKNL